ncbi:Putative hydrolase MhqD [Rhodobacteraceae bacterium THAF1]|uniref:alpha/beta hydrolase n=1 Tax=Palleronia sp. THAF1 TaxID=2587842 RepID=UPI000F3F64D5|nr:alpha/beta hydrolase [Palleronia sp. THAF1]QFU09900.1 Putative hydrolase MhqD [Palleronia sp. THAF1]VDC17197.1 Putative hydrolase MhqD [Rhodobacteraceae bacterium THAF1]
MTYEALRHDGSAPKIAFTFHGTGAQAAQLHGVAQQFLPEHHVVSPEGDVDEGGAARFFRRTGEGVYDMDDLAARVAAMAKFVQAERDRTGATHATGIGYSNGANILCATAMAHPDLFDALVLMHPLIPWQPQPQPKMAMMRVLITAGQNDPICPAPQTQALAEWFTDQKADCLLAWHPGGHEVQQSEIDAIRDFLV